MLSAVHIFAQFGFAQTIKPNDERLKIFGREDHLAYVDLNKLLTGIDHKDKDIFTLYNSKLKPASFFQKFNWNLGECWSGSILRDGVSAYCLPYLQLGYSVLTDYPKKVERFVPATQYEGVYIWYEEQSNSYYIWGSSWNFEYALGPFTGEPITALTKAIKPRKEKRSFPGIKFELISQGWTFPDMPEPPPPAPCYTSYCPQYEIIFNYQKVTTRLRLVNNSKKTLYYLADNSQAAAPIGFGLSRKIGQVDWVGSAILKKTGISEIGGIYSRWIPFPPDKAVEIELIGRGSKGYEYAYVVILNNEPKNWDEVKLLTNLPVMLREIKSESIFR